MQTYFESKAFTRLELVFDSDGSLLTFTLETGLVRHWFAAHVAHRRVADRNTDELVRSAGMLVLSHLQNTQRQR